MFFSKLKDLTRFAKKKNPIDLDGLQEKLTGGLFNVLEDTFSKQQANPVNSHYTPADIDVIAAGYAKKNMAIAAATSLVPGPLGILGVVPELVLTFGNKMQMIYDLGCANNKENSINKDLLIDIPIAAFGGNTNLAALQNIGGQLQESPITALKGKVKDLGQSVIDKQLKKSVVQFIPVAGPVLMGIWAKMTTNKVATTSNTFFDESATYVEHFKKEETEEVKRALQVQKIKGLANLIEANNEINEAQIAFIGPIIENAAIPQSQKNHLLEESLKVGSNFQLDYQLLKDYEEDETLVMELVIMAKRSGSVDHFEKAYIFRVAEELKMDKGFVEDLLL